MSLALLYAVIRFILEAQSPGQADVRLQAEVLALRQQLWSSSVRSVAPAGSRRTVYSCPPSAAVSRLQPQPRT